jgi:hypothetical protein
MSITIKRIEIDKDHLGRQVVHETRVADYNGWTASETLHNLIDEIYTNEDGEGIDYDVSSDSTRELEVYGSVVLRYLDKLDKAVPNDKVKEHFVEDGVNRSGEHFLIEDAIYSIEEY